METDAAPASSSQPLPPDGSSGRFAGWRKVLAAVWPALIATVLLLCLVGYTVRAVKANEHGRFVYTVDDGYFHMAVARNVLQHGLWGINALDGFSSGTSSLLWPLLIAASFAVCGIHEYLPFVLNLLAGIGLLFYAGWVIRRTTGSSFLGVLVLLAIVLFVPILTVASTGMEHNLQALLGVIFVDLAARLLTADGPRLASRGASVWLCVVGMLLVMTRYEGLFLIAPVGLLLLCQRRWTLAVALGVVSAAPVVVFGLIAVWKGWYFLPNSLLIKGNTKLVPTLDGVFNYFVNWYDVLTTEQHMFALVAAVTAMLIGSLRRRWTLWNYPSLFLFITLLAALQHLQFAKIGWFYRYEAYLIALGLLGVGVAFGYEPAGPGWRYWRSVRALPQGGALALAALLFGAPLWQRGIGSIDHVVTASYNIYEQQYQMGHFVRRFYDGKGVAANDVGAVSFFGHLRLVDVVGLSDIAVLRARRSDSLTPALLDRLCRQRHVELAMLYDNWAGLYGGILPGWVRVGQWTIQNNTIVGDPTVSFYATDAALVPELSRQLREFGATLPKDIVQDGIYRDPYSLEATGTYGPEGALDARVYWTGASAQFTVYPRKDQPSGPDGIRLAIMVFPVGKDLSVDVFCNGERVATQAVTAGEPARWQAVQVDVHLRSGANTLRLVGHGTPVYPSGDTRPFLFRVLDPRKTMDHSEQVIPQDGLEPAIR